MPPKKRKPSGLGRSSAHANRMKAHCQTEEGRADHVTRELAAYHVRSHAKNTLNKKGHRQVGKAGTQEKAAERNTTARSIRREDKEFNDHERH
jgi:hypothetical protein